MAAKYIPIVLFNIVSICLQSQAELKSPCPNVFLYQPRDDSTDRWYGLLNLASEYDNFGVEMKLTLDRPALQLGNLLGETTTYDLKQFTITNRYFRMAANSSHLVRFYVEYDSSKMAPALLTIEQNGRRICPDLAPSGPKVFVSIVLQANNPINPIGKPSPTAEDEEQIPCGTIAAQASPLIIGSQVSKIGDYPWHAAICSNVANNIMFYCGGSLVSKNVVVTSVICLLIKRHAIEEVEVHLGRFSSRDIGPYVQIHKVSDRIAHPKHKDDNNSGYPNDVGLLKLKEPATFNDFVRPVCLNPPDSEFEHLIGKIGTIPGWGATETATLSEELRYATMKVVSNLDCLSVRFKYYLTRSSFCSAPVNETTGCFGDSGGGLVFPEETEGRKTYYLRGILSQGTPICFPGESGFEVFTDPLEYLNFIITNM